MREADGAMHRGGAGEGGDSEEREGVNDGFALGVRDDRRMREAC